MIKLSKQFDLEAALVWRYAYFVWLKIMYMQYKRKWLPCVNSEIALEGSMHSKKQNNNFHQQIARHT